MQHVHRSWAVMHTCDGSQVRAKNPLYPMSNVAKFCASHKKGTHSYYAKSPNFYILVTNLNLFITLH